MPRDGTSADADASVRDAANEAARRGAASLAMVGHAERFVAEASRTTGLPVYGATLAAVKLAEVLAGLRLRQREPGRGGGGLALRSGRAGFTAREAQPAVDLLPRAVLADAKVIAVAGGLLLAIAVELAGARQAARALARHRASALSGPGRVSRPKKPRCNNPPPGAFMSLRRMT